MLIKNQDKIFARVAVIFAELVNPLDGFSKDHLVQPIRLMDGLCLCRHMQKMQQSSFLILRFYLHWKHQVSRSSTRLEGRMKSARLNTELPLYFR